MQISSMNVIEMEDDAIVRLSAFDVSDEGRAEARACFSERVQSHDPEASETDVSEFLEEGYYETGSYQLFLVESADA